jgi:ElaB/YqjD/DUF883 family membrane-anchored ribosome-binding protein
MGQQKTGIASCLLTDHRRSSLERKPQTSVEKLVPGQWSEAWTRPIYNRCATTCTVAEFVSQAGTDAVKTARDVTSNVACQVGNAASNVAEKGAEIATTASKQAKTFASELETLGRNNPLGAMAAAMMVGVLIGLIGRGRM